MREKHLTKLCMIKTHYFYASQKLDGLQHQHSAVSYTLQHQNIVISYLIVRVAFHRDEVGLTVGVIIVTLCAPGEHSQCWHLLLQLRHCMWKPVVQSIKCIFILALSKHRVASVPAFVPLSTSSRCGPASRSKSLALEIWCRDDTGIMHRHCTGYLCPARF